VTSELSVLEQQLPKTSAPECFFPEVAKAAVPTNPTWIARKLGIDYSVYKLNAAAMLVRNEHIYDALALIENCAKKGGKIVNSVVQAARVNGIRKGYAEERMWVKEVVLGKKLGGKKMDIRARGKFGIIHAPISHITVILEERSPVDFYK
jgi:ribosomal protein L22